MDALSRLAIACRLEHLRVAKDKLYQTANPEEIRSLGQTVASERIELARLFSALESGDAGFRLARTGGTLVLRYYRPSAPTLRPAVLPVDPVCLEHLLDKRGGSVTEEDEIPIDLGFVEAALDEALAATGHALRTNERLKRELLSYRMIVLEHPQPCEMCKTAA